MPARHKEKETKSRDVHQAEHKRGNVAGTVEHPVGNQAGGHSANNAAYGTNRYNQRRVKGTVSLLCLKVEHTPGVDGIARDVHERRGKSKTPYGGIAQHGLLGPVEVGRVGFLHVTGHNLGRWRFRIGKSEALWSIVHEKHYEQKTTQTNHSRTEHTVAPACPTYKHGYGYEGDGLAQIVGGRPEAIVSATVL